VIDKDTVVKTNPDPTEAVKEALTLAIKNLTDKIGDRFDLNDKAVVLARSELAAQLTAVIMTIDSKFVANKDLVDQLAKANAVALTAALSTQKESAAKSEVAVGESLKQLQASFETANRTTNEKIDRLTSRMDTSEGRGFGNVETRRDSSTDKTQMIAIVMAAVAIIGVVITALTHWK